MTASDDNLMPGPDEVITFINGVPHRIYIAPDDPHPWATLKARHAELLREAEGEP